MAVNLTKFAREPLASPLYCMQLHRRSCIIHVRASFICTRTSSMRSTRFIDHCTALFLCGPLLINGKGIARELEKTLVAADVTKVSQTLLLLLVPDLSSFSTFAHAIAEREVTRGRMKNRKERRRTKEAPSVPLCHYVRWRVWAAGAGGEEGRRG